MANFVRELVSLKENRMELSIGLVCSRDELYILIHVVGTSWFYFSCTLVRICTIFNYQYICITPLPDTFISVALRYGPCLMESHRVTCNPNVAYSWRVMSHNWNNDNYNKSYNMLALVAYRRSLEATKAGLSTRSSCTMTSPGTCGTTSRHRLRRESTCTDCTSRTPAGTGAAADWSRPSRRSVCSRVYWPWYILSDLDTWPR